MKEKQQKNDRKTIKRIEEKSKKKQQKKHKM